MVMVVTMMMAAMMPVMMPAPGANAVKSQEIGASAEATVSEDVAKAGWGKAIANVNKRIVR